MKSAARKVRIEPQDAVDVTQMAGSRLSASDAALLRKYQDALYKATYWPCVDHFRDCVAAFDAMIARPTDV